MEDAMKKKEDEMNTMLDEERSRSTASNSEKQEIADLKLDLENKLEEAQSLNDSMKQELDRVYEDHAEETRQLRDQVAVAQSEAGSGSTSADADLQQENDELRVALREQQQVTEEVRQEAQVWLKEMRALSQQSEARYEKQVELEQTVDRLEHEVREWRNRYSRAKTQVRSMRASVLGLPIEPEAANLVHDQGFTSDHGLVKDVHVTRYQTAIDELLQRARKEHPEKVTDAMKSVVVTVRRITKDVDETTSHDEAFLQQRSKLKAKVSSTANHLITASKNFAAGAGLSPVSLVDAAASHLTAAIVELLRGAKIRPTPSEELEEDDDGTITPVESAGFFSPRTTTRASSMHQENAPPPPPAFQGLNGMRASVDSSAYSPIQSPRESMHPTTNGYGYMNHKDAPPMTNGYGNYHQTADVHNGYDFS